MSFVMETHVAVALPCRLCVALACDAAVQLRTWEAFKQLKKMIEDFQTKLPLLSDLSRPSIRARHWDAIESTLHCSLRTGSELEFKLGTLLELDVTTCLGDLEEVADAAEKELAIEVKLSELAAKWKSELFRFGDWRGRGVPILLGLSFVLEDLEEVCVSAAALHPR